VPFSYTETYLSPREGRIGAGLNLALISAAPDPSFYFKPFASNSSSPIYGQLLYNSTDGFQWPVTISPNNHETVNVWPMWIGGGTAINFTFGATDGVLRFEGADQNGGWVFCKIHDSTYGNFTSVHWFNGTGTPDNTSCLDIEIIHG
jgi:hypothetical protein